VYQDAAPSCCKPRTLQQPKLENGQLIFFSKLKGERWDTDVLQAEYYGGNLYLCKLAKGHPFNPYQDPKAKEIYAQALSGWQGGVWDRDSKLKSGRLDL